MWDLTLAEIFKVDNSMKIKKMTLLVDKKLYRVNRPKMMEWGAIHEGQKILVTVDKSDDKSYGKLYNMSERTEAKVKIKNVTSVKNK